MLRTICRFLVIILIFIPAQAYAEDAQKLDRIIVTPSRLPAYINENSRSLILLDEERFEASVYRAIPDVIGEISGIDIRRRGPQGVQADVNIRGTTFEQNTVLIDGIRVNDPQTGHFTMDIPLTIGDVDSVEILKGPASNLYGANAFGGVVNIITKRPSEEKVVLYGEGGAYDYYDGGCSITLPAGPVKNRFSFEQSRSTGYMPQTDFNILSLTNSALIETGMGVYNFLFGYQNKDFAAASFYSNLFPNEYERTDTKFFKLDGKSESGGLSIEPKLFLRRHGDKFVLDQNRTGWQTNYSTDYSYGGELDFSLENAFADASWGYELSHDTIDSTNLGTHSRTKNGFYTEISPHLAEGLYLNISFREDYYSDFAWQASPGVSVSYKALEHLTLRGSFGYAHRIPTFTDLYYNDAANRGNSSLMPESSSSYEAGAKFDHAVFSVDTAYFHRDSYDTIDWIRRSSASPWSASNIGSAIANGLELTLAVMPERLWGETPVKRLSVSNTMIDIAAKHDYFSKYALDYLKEEMSACAEMELAGFKNSWILSYKKRVGDPGYVAVDTKISKEIVKSGKISFEAYVEASNLFDADYSEQSGVPMPGRWVVSGARLKF
ncbi:MAG: TonB-dependent receptor [Candidatus Omnitrophota bacterium]